MILLILLIGSSFAQKFICNSSNYIKINYKSTFDEEQSDLIDKSICIWNMIISNDMNNINPYGLTIELYASDLGGLGGRIGTTTIKNIIDSKNNGTTYTYSTNAKIELDIADLDSLNENLFDLMVHEIGHAIGIGILWNNNNVYINDSGQYTGKYAVLKYNEKFNNNLSYVPVELSCGNGCKNAHWEESTFGTEIMTPILSGTNYLSYITIYSLKDIGITINNIICSVNETDINYKFMELCLNKNKTKNRSLEIIGIIFGITMLIILLLLLLFVIRMHKLKKQQKNIIPIYKKNNSDNQTIQNNNNYNNNNSLLSTYDQLVFASVGEEFMMNIV